MSNRSTGMPRVDAHEDFARARRAQIAARAARWLGLLPTQVVNG